MTLSTVELASGCTVASLVASQRYSAPLSDSSRRMSTSASAVTASWCVSEGSFWEPLYQVSVARGLPPLLTQVRRWRSPFRSSWPRSYPRMTGVSGGPGGEGGERGEGVG